MWEHFDMNETMKYLQASSDYVKKIPDFKGEPGMKTLKLF